MLKGESNMKKNIAMANEMIIVAGPCCVESEEQILDIANKLKRMGVTALRGGAYKSRTHPQNFQGLGFEGVKLLHKAGKNTGLPIVTEVIDTRDVETIYEYCDIIQIGARNIQNYPLLKEVGKTGKPILLKNGFSTTMEEYLGCIEYIYSEGNRNVLICLRGIRTFENYTRNTLDISMIKILKEKTDLPVIVDPSHSTGRTELIEPMSLGAIMAGADGLIIEVHNNPVKALCDGNQSLNIIEFEPLLLKIKKTYKFRNDLYS